MNREQRRHPEKDQRPPVVPEREMSEAERPQETLDPRTKASGHGKKTADKWNQ
jgi:hypothetical protein